MMKPTCIFPWPVRLCRFELVTGVLSLVLWTGCGSNPSSTAGPSKASKVSAAASVRVPLPAPGATNGNAGPVLTRSVFHVGPRSGRDPFFPNSQRNVAKAEESAPAVHLPLASYLKLVGIWAGTARPMALINKTPLALGEEGDVTIVISNRLGKAELQKVNVRCLEIRRDSVLVNIAGDSGAKELRLAQRK